MATSSSTKRVTVILAGSAAGLEKTFTEASVAADAASKEMSGAFEVSGEKTGGAFKKLSSLFAGIPVLGASFAKMGEAVDGADTKSGKFFTNLANVGKIATVAGVAGLAAAGAESIHLAEKYQTATATLQGSANISAGAAKQIGDAFLGTGFKTIFSAQQQMQAFSGVAAQLGTIQGKALDAAQAQQFMAAAGDLAEGSSTDLGTTTAALAATMQAFHISTSGAASAADELFNAARFTNTGIGTVSTAVDKLHARLGVAVPSLTDTTALMTELGEHGVVGTKGITTVSTALTTLLGGSKATSAELTSLGVHVFDAQGKFVGMQGVIAQLGPKLAMMSQQSQLAAEKTLFGASAAQIMGQVMQGGVAGYDAAAAAVSRTGSAATAAAAQNQTLGKQIDLLKAGAEDLGVKFGQWLIPKMEEAAKVAAKGITWLEQHKQVAEVLAGVIGGALVVAIAAYTVSMIAAAAATVAATWPVLAIIAAVAAVGVGIYELATHWQQVWGDIKQWTGDAIHPILNLFGDIKYAWLAFVGIITGGQTGYFDAFSKNMGFLIRPITDVGMAIRNTIRFFEEFPGEVESALSTFGSGVVHELQAFPGQLLNLFEQGFEWVIAGIIAFDIKAVEYFASLPGKVLDAVVKFGPGIVEWMASAFWALDGAIAAGVEDAVKFFVSIPGKLLHAVVEFGPGVAKWTADAFVSLVQVAVDGEIGVTKFFLSLPGKIVTALGDATKWLYGIGEDVIKGLIKGMEDIIPDIAKTAGHIASGIEGKVKGLLGINSPSKVFHDIGLGVGEGFINGLTASQQPVTTASSKLVSAAHAGAFSNGGTGASGGSKQPVTINVQLAGKNVAQLLLPDFYALQRSGTPLAITRNGRPIGAT